MKSPLRVLQIEDSQSDAAMILRHLDKAGYAVQSVCVETADDLRAALGAQEWDIVISDFLMPQFDANAALAIFKEFALDIPFIVVSGTIGEDIAVEMMRSGAHDYLLKDKMARLAPAVARELSEVRIRRAGQQSKSERDLMFNLSIDPLCIADFERNFKQVNPAWARIFGWNAEDLLGKAWINLIHPSDREATLDLLNMFIAGESVAGFENRFACRDGTYRWMSWNIVSVRAQQLIFASGRDITEKMQAEEQLKLTGACLSHLNDSVMITEAHPLDEPGPRIVYVNDAFVAKTGYDFEEIIGRSPRFLQGSRTSREELDRVRNAMVNGEPIRVELINYTRTGQEFVNEIDIVPVFDDAGSLTHFVSIQRDISERKRIEAALRESEEHYREVAAFNQKLVHEVNHRVRNNLAALLSLIAMSRKRSTDLASFASSIESRVRSLSHVHNLMSTSGGRSMELSEIVDTLNHVAKQMVASQTATSQISPNTIGVRIGGPPIWLDPIQILPLAFALVELFNNCVSHGAYSSKTGNLQIDWTIKPIKSGSRITMRWLERGGPLIAVPITPKLGLKLVEGFMNYDLGGRCVLNFLPEGTDHIIEFTVPDSVGSPGTAGSGGSGGSSGAAAARQQQRPEHPA